jgi:rhamnose utilization protein RhaD (predicted bifunctional aldolase and dehydrogenase)/NAD(P)-dependent dehydrogenase (short-subunit alcohol dehydrogenase family)
MTEPSQTELLHILCTISRTYGADPEIVIAGGGNTSVKIGQRLWVKGSGHALATITPDGFVEMDRPALETLLGRDLGSDRVKREEQFKDAVMAARVDPSRGQRPSVEVVLHHLMPGRFVVHTHATLVNMFTCTRDGQKLIERICGDNVIWIADVDPGHILAQTLRDALIAYKKKTGRDRPRAVVMQNHGLVISGDTADEIRGHTDWLLGVLEQELSRHPVENPFGPVHLAKPEEARKTINVIGPALRGLLAADNRLKIVTYDDSQPIVNLVGGPDGKHAAITGPLTPDQVVYCKSFPLWFEVGDAAGADAIVSRLRDAVAEYTSRTQSAPQVVLIAGLGMFTAGDDVAGARTAKLVYADAAKIMAGATRLGGIRYLDPDKRDFFEKWEVEAYRRQIAKGSAKAGRAVSKVALVTGAAQGFGLEIAQDLASQGAAVVLTDINAAGAAAAADAICRQHGQGRAIGLAVNVAEGASVDQAIHWTVREFGGIDLLVSNAGVLRAESVKTQSEKDFDLTTSVNYKGYFVCVQKASPVMSIQHLAKPDCWTDIIQINSKSGLQGSNRNFAYAGSKFGGIGLTQSFAMELVTDGIKVNSICPGNFFEGPLWSDPNNGLFVQYLRSGKVPGAKTIADVKKSYESRVPMGRGCATADVMKAIYYLMEQLYETGQAVPVTGGQVMLK